MNMLTCATGTEMNMLTVDVCDRAIVTLKVGQKISRDIKMALIS